MKYNLCRPKDLTCRRSREGAWIEMARTLEGSSPNSGRSREGAWIEMLAQYHFTTALVVAPARERGLKSFRRRVGVGQRINVAPARERGLKYNNVAT